MLVRIGGTASSTSATSVGVNPKASDLWLWGRMFSTRMNTSTNTANDGTARPTLAMETAKNSPFLVWPMYSPTGTAMAAATATESRDSSTCWNTRIGMPSNPRQWAPETSHCTALERVCIRPGPLGEPTWPMG